MIQFLADRSEKNIGNAAKSSTDQLLLIVGVGVIY
jgi:hypothetical protein